MKKVIVRPETGLCYFAGSSPRWHWYPASVVARTLNLGVREMIGRYWGISKDADSRVLAYTRDGNVMSADWERTAQTAENNPEGTYLPAGWVNAVVQEHYGLTTLMNEVALLRGAMNIFMEVAASGKSSDRWCRDGDTEEASLRSMAKMVRKLYPQITAAVINDELQGICALVAYDPSRWQLTDDDELVPVA